MFDIHVIPSICSKIQTTNYCSFTTFPATCISRMHSMVQPSPWCNKLLCFDLLLQEMMLYELLGNEIGKRGRNFSSCFVEVSGFVPSKKKGTSIIGFLFNICVEHLFTFHCGTSASFIIFNISSSCSAICYDLVFG